jgi:N4-gp56 family major capsid protein
MVNITTSDVLTEQRIRRVIEEEREYPLIFNDMFRRITMPDDYASKTMEIPEDDGLMSQPQRVGEGSEFPRTEEDYSTTPVTVKKHGFEVAITWEATQFSVFDTLAQQTEKAARRFNEYINELAFNVVSNASNQHADSPVTPSDISGSEFGYELATYAKKVLKDDQVNPDMMVVNTEGEHVLLNSNNFQRASDLGDEVTREGAIGRFAGLDVMVDNSGLMASDTAEAYLVDTNEYGYEVVKEDIATDEYEDNSRQAQIVQWFTMREWLAIEPNALIKMEP